MTDIKTLQQAERQLEEARGLLARGLCIPESNFLYDIFSDRYAMFKPPDYLKWALGQASVVQIESLEVAVPDFPRCLKSNLRPKCVNDYVCYETTGEVCEKLKIPLNYCEGIMFTHPTAYRAVTHVWNSYQGRYFDVARDKEVGGHSLDSDIYLLFFEVSCQQALRMAKDFAEHLKSAESDCLAYAYWKHQIDGH